jgi:hypothetical protein
MLGHVGGSVGDWTGILRRDRGQLGGFGGHVSEDRTGLSPGLVDHLLELADPALTQFAGSRGLISARAPGGGLARVRTFALFRWIVRIHLNTSNSTRIG